MDTLAKAVPDAGFAAARIGKRALVVIGIFKMIKASLFLIAALAVFQIVNKDTGLELKKVLHAFRISGDREFARQLLIKANGVTPEKKLIGSSVLAFYALLFATEGTGLLLRKRWGEWCTAILTSTGIPIEVYELFHHTNRTLKLGVLVLNILILWFLILHLRRTSRPVMPQPLAKPSLQVS
jgi:uncharacterized membrane protein (DUF2068 family)